MLTLGLGIACTTTVFSWIDSVLLHPYPGTARSDELASLEMVTAGSAQRRQRGLSGSTIATTATTSRDLRAGGTPAVAFTLGDAQPARLTWGELVSGNYFEVMGVKPLLGRVFARDERGDSLGRLSRGGDQRTSVAQLLPVRPGIVGKTRAGQPALPDDCGSGAGRVPRHFAGDAVRFLGAGHDGAGSRIAAGDRLYASAANAACWTTICRRRRGVSVAQARAEAVALAAGLAAANPKTNRGVGADVLPTWEEHNGVNEYLRAPLGILLAVSFVVLLIVCANVANLLLARAVGGSGSSAFAARSARDACASPYRCSRRRWCWPAPGAGVGMLMLLWMQGSLLGNGAEHRLPDQHGDTP